MVSVCNILVVRLVVNRSIYLASIQSKGTLLKEALAKWAEKNGEDPKEAKVIKLYMQLPPIEKMDATLSTLPNCE